MAQQTPQQKKRLSVTKDRRNTYGESPHGARKSIPRNKRARVRAERRAAKVHRNQNDEDGLDQDTADARARLKHVTGWAKIPDTPLGEVVKVTKERRKRLMVNPRKATSKARAAAGGMSQ